MVRAEYWRRHVTEVHKTPTETELIKQITICEPCYVAALEISKDAKVNGHKDFIRIKLSLSKKPGCL